MKLITLNLWGGIVYEPLMKFIESHADDADIFCFQEMLFGENPQSTKILKARENLFSEISKRLPEFVPYKYLSEVKYFAAEPIEFKAGQVIFVRKGIKVKDSGNFRTYDKLPVLSTFGGKLTGSFQWVELEINNETFTICSLHGIWQEGTGKVDTPERIVQSQKIKDFLDAKNKNIFCGDFNLAPDGKSIEILEEGMVNLVEKYNIQSTRSSFYNKEQKFADYILISSNVEVKDFKVLDDQVSDHLPLMLDFNS